MCGSGRLADEHGDDTGIEGADNIEQAIDDEEGLEIRFLNPQFRQLVQSNQQNEKYDLRLSAVQHIGFDVP